MNPTDDWFTTTLLVGVAADGPWAGRYVLTISPDWSARYHRDDNTLANGRLLHNQCDYVEDPTYGTLERTALVLQILGPGKLKIGVENSQNEIDCELKNNMRFYMIPRVTP